jgi:hypothetical protein
LALVSQRPKPRNLSARIKHAVLTRATDTIPENEVQRLRLVLRALAAGSALVHGAFGVYCLVKYVQTPAASPHSFALHHTRVSAQLTNSSCSAPSFALQRVDHIGLCARSWLARHPAKTEITGSSWGLSHHTNIFFFFCKNHEFSRFLINFSTVVVVKHTHVVDPKLLTHIHSHRDLNSLSLSTESTYLLVPMP